MKIFTALAVFILMAVAGCLILLSQKVSAQGFHDFAPVGAVWYYNYEPNCACDGVVRVSCESDTVISGAACRKLKVQRVVYQGYLNIIDTTGISYEYLKIDSYRVYQYSLGQFILLYDFNALVGDIWEIPGTGEFGCDSTGKIRVDSIGKFVAGIDTLKIFYTSPYNGSVWIYDSPVVERFGSLGFLIPEPIVPCIVDVDFGGPLRCYSDSTFGSYIFDTTVACDWFFASSNNISPEKPSLAIFPNPFTTSTAIALPSQQKISTIKLFDELGREVSLPYQSSQQGNKTQLTIEKGNLPSGIYFLSIISNKKREIVKLMVE